jgi:hypothetical protein
MAVFDTPEPISAVVDLSIGEIRIIASDRADTVVDVRPADEASAADVQAAGQVSVELTRGKLQVKAPPQARRRAGTFRHGGSIEVRIELPEGSAVRCGSVLAAIHGEGRLGDCRIDTMNSEIRFEQTGPLRVTAVGGDITVAKVTGSVKITNGSGGVRVEEIDGSAVIKNDHGDTVIGEITGGLQLTGMNGDFQVERAHGDAEVKTAHGNIRIGEVARGTVVLTTAFGEIEVGVRAGTAAKLDIRTVSGRILNSLESVTGPEHSDEIVEVRAHTFDGDVLIRRS